MVGEHVVRRLVIDPGHVVAPLEQHLEHAQLVDAMRVPTPLSEHVEVVVLHDGLLVGLERETTGLVDSGAQKGFWVEGVARCACLEQVNPDAIVDVEQVVGVFTRILLHLLR